jgi:1,4-dihydroxy-2-naphthoyl-CoA hydrolase
MNAASPVTTDTVHRLVPFARHLGVTFSRIDPESVTAHLPETDQFGTVGGGVHGGAIMALADISAAVMSVVASGEPAAVPATMQSSTNFLHPLRGTATAHARVVRPGRSTVVDVEVRDEADTLCALVRQVVAVRKP